MKKSNLNRIVLGTFFALMTIHSNMKAVVGVLFLAAQGPSIPTVMNCKQIFEKKIAHNTTIVSENPKIIRASMAKKTYVLEALQPGTTTIHFKKNTPEASTNKNMKPKNKKQASTTKKDTKNTITVAYNSIEEIPKSVPLNTVLYCVTTHPITHAPSCKNTKIRISKKRKGNNFYYEIKCATPGELVLTDGTKTRATTIETTEKTTQETQAKNTKKPKLSQKK